MKGEMIKIACTGAALLTIDELQEFQDDLKDLSEKNYQRMRKEIVETGVGFPFRCWRFEGAVWIIGGHQAKRTLIRLRDEEGFEIPRVPVSWIEARDRKEAKRRVLQDIAQYGKVQRQKFFDFLGDAGIDIDFVQEQFDIPDFDMPGFKFEYFSDPVQVPPPDDSIPQPVLSPAQQEAQKEWANGMPEYDQQDKTAERRLIVNFKNDQDFQAFCTAIGQELTDKTRSIWFPKAEIETMMDKRYVSNES